MNKLARFIPIRITLGAKQLADAYIREIVRLHGVPRTIVSDRDPKFLLRFWEKLQEAFGTKLCLSISFQPATDGQIERTIQTLEDLLRCCVLDFEVSWEDKRPMVEFVYRIVFKRVLRYHRTKLFMAGNIVCRYAEI